MTSTNPAQLIAPLTADTFEFAKITFGRPHKFEEYGFTRHNIGYSRADTQDDKCVIKLTNITVFGVYAPKPDAEGKMPKNPKYSMSVATSEPAQIKFFNDLNKYVKELAFKNRLTWFTNGADITTEDIDMLYAKPVGSEIVGDDGKPLYKFIISFPFNNPNVKDPVNIHYYETANAPVEAVQSVDLLQKLCHGCVIDMFFQLTNIKVDDTNEFNCQTTIHKRINVQKYVASGSGSGRSSGPSKGMSPAEVDVNNIVMGDVITDPKHGGRSLKPKYKYIARDGTEQLRSVSITMADIRCKFKRQAKVNEETGAMETSFDVTYDLSPEHLAKFKEIDEYIKKDMLANYSTKYEPGKKTNAKLFEGKFKGAVKTPEKYEPNMWYNVFTKKKADGTFDFGGNFYKPDNTKYTDAEIEKDIFGKDHKCTLTVYLKHVWFGKYYSTKFNFGNAILSTTAVDYDYGDAYNDSHATATSGNTPSLSSYSAGAAADLEQEDDVASQGSVMSDGN